MSDDAEKKSENARPGRRADTYHGIRLARVRGTSRFTAKELRRAVDMAIKKNRHLLTNDR